MGFLDIKSSFSLLQILYSTAKITPFKCNFFFDILNLFYHLIYTVEIFKKMLIFSVVLEVMIKLLKLMKLKDIISKM